MVASDDLSILLAIPSAVYARRVNIRCSLRVQQWACKRCRHLFLVGDHGDHMPHDARWADVMHMPSVREAVQAYMPARQNTDHSLTGTLTTFLKMAIFFQHAAAHATESIIARADDDTFVSLPAL